MTGCTGYCRPVPQVSTAPRSAAALLFALLHAPNPVLVPCAAVAGAFWCWHFVKHRNLPALMLSHFLLGLVAMICLGKGPLLGLRVGYPACDGSLTLNPATCLWSTRQGPLLLIWPYSSNSHYPRSTAAAAKPISPPPSPRARPSSARTWSSSATTTSRTRSSSSPTSPATASSSASSPPSRRERREVRRLLRRALHGRVRRHAHRRQASRSSCPTSSAGCCMADMADYRPDRRSLGTPSARTVDSQLPGSSRSPT